MHTLHTFYYLYQVENGQAGLEESDADISGCQGGMLTKASGTTEVGNDLATIGSNLAVE